MGQYRHRFQVYHPYLTFSDPNNRRFIGNNGKPRGELGADTEALFLIGKKVYGLFKDPITKEDFDCGLELYSEFIEETRADLAELDATKALRFQFSGEIRNGIDWDEIEDHVIIELAWNMTNKHRSMLTIDEAATSHLARVFAMHAYIEIDNALISLEIHSDGAVVAACVASNALANLLSLQLGNGQLQQARRDLAYQGAVARIQNDPKQKEKTFVHECWLRWQQSPETYASKAAFARDMLSKCEHLTSQKKIEDWCRGWEADTGTQQAQ